MKLYDGREKFYQYDTNQKLICEDCAVGEEVHFSNGAHSDAAICLTYDLDGTVVVNVPNLYLMYAVDLNVYSMRTEDDGRCTISRHVFGVVPRKKPSDYVYEETEVKSYAELDRRIKKLEENAGAGIDQDELQAAVNAAIEQAKAGLLVFEDSYVDNTANWLTNGYTKVSQTATSGHPPQCTGSDKWGVLFFIAENAANGTGTHMYFPIDGTYKGRVFTRSVTRRVPGEWYLLSTMDDIPTGGGGGGGADHTLGLSGAAVGQIARITAVDGNGVPTAWDSVDLPAGGSGGEKWDIHYKTNIAEPLAEGFEITEVDGEPLQLKEMWAMVKLQNGSETQQWLGCVVKTDNADLSGTASDYGGAYTGVGKYAYFVYHAIVIGNGRAVCEIRFGENRASKLNFCTNGPWLNNWLDHNRVQYIKGIKCANNLGAGTAQGYGTEIELWGVRA